MEYIIGVGLIIDDEYFFNMLRDYQLQATKSTTNFVGLSQPPHITIKSPFSVSNERALEQVYKTIESFAASQPKLEVSFSEFGSFGTGTIYLQPNPTDQLVLAHRRLLKVLLDNHGIGPNKLEGGLMVFHATVANGLSESEFKIAQAVLSVTHDTGKKLTFRELGIFLGLPNNGWIIIKRIALR